MVRIHQGASSVNRAVVQSGCAADWASRRRCVKPLDEAPQGVTTGAAVCERKGRSPYVRGTSFRVAVLPSPDPQSRTELTTQLAVACLGAGVITSIAVAQGQNPLTALGITLFSAVAAVAVGQVL